MGMNKQKKVKCENCRNGPLDHYGVAGVCGGTGKHEPFSVWKSELTLECAINKTIRKKSNLGRLMDEARTSQI